MLSAILISGEEVTIRPLEKGDADALFKYLGEFSEVTKRRFGPHSFEEAAIRAICDNLDPSDCFRVVCFAKGRCVAYALLKLGLLEADAQRLLSYGLETSGQVFATYAPSVAESHQGLGVAELMLRYLEDKTREDNVTQIVLWGGVQQGNPRAVRFYEKNGFVKVGSFDLNGGDDDMVKYLT